MTRQQIIEESNYLAIQFADADIDVRDAIKIGFQYAANWRIDSVWHNKHTVIPEAGRTALLELKDPDTHKTVYKIDTYCGEEWRELTHYEYSGLVRFAYIDDLLPQGKEEK